MWNHSFAISQREIEFISLKKGWSTPAEPALTDNWPIPFSEYIQRTLHHAALWTGPSHSIPVIGSRSRRHLTANPVEGQEACLTYPPPLHHYWDQLYAVGLSSRGWLHIDGLVMEVKMSSGYQSGSITTFKASKSTYTTQRSPNPLKRPADFILQAQGMNVVFLPPHRVLDQQIRVLIDEPQVCPLSIAFLQLRDVVIPLLAGETEQGLESFTFWSVSQINQELDQDSEMPLEQIPTSLTHTKCRLESPRAQKGLLMR